MGRQQPDHTLQTTVLVNEVYLRLVAFTEVSWADRAHFFAVCAIRLRLVSFSGARDSITFQRPLNSSISAMSFRISGVIVMSLIPWVWISIYTHFHPIAIPRQEISIYTHLCPFRIGSKGHADSDVVWMIVQSVVRAHAQ